MFRRLAIAAALCCGLLFGARPVHAAGVQFAVAAELPSNQLNQKLHYFDLLVTPGSRQQLSILIQNTASGSQTFMVSPNRAGTAADGHPDYSKHGAKLPASLAVDFESLMPKPKKYTVAPHSTRRVKLQLTAPQTAWRGIILGAIHVEQLTDTQSASGVGVASHAAYNIGVQLQATKTLPTQTPQLQFNGVRHKTTASGTTVAALLENPAPALQPGLAVKARVTHAGKQVLATSGTAMKMAPNSVMAFPLAATPKNLKPGKYQLHVDATNGDQQWHFTRSFTIAAVVMKSRPTTLKVRLAQFPLWATLTLAAVVAALLFLIWRLRRRH